MSKPAKHTSPASSCHFARAESDSPAPESCSPRSIASGENGSFDSTALRAGRQALTAGRNKEPGSASPDCRTADAACLNVIYCDHSLLVCEKPVNCLSEPGPGANLPALAVDWLRARGEATEIRTVHRLDKAVGGLMVLARTQAAAASLIGQIAARTTEKEYLAVLRGLPAEDEATLEDLLFHDSRTNKTFVVSRPRKGVRDAKLHYRVLGRAEGENGPLCLVRVKLFTGRTHQIRAQFSHRGLPLLGDIRYGSKASHGPALFSCHLAFAHPVSGKRMTFSLLPQGEPWSHFGSLSTSIN